MVGIVRVALSKPLTFVVMAILIAIIGILSAVRAPVDIFPNIRVPVIATAWNYAGLPPEEMSGRVITPFERALTTTVNDIEHIESQSMQGIGVVKIFFQPGADIRTATAQVTSISQTMLRQLPPGTTPPLILNYNASTVPILQLAMQGRGFTESQLFDMAQNQVRPSLVTVPGAATPLPSGGSQRQIQIDLDPEALQSKGLSAQDVGNAIAAQNQINPAGFAKIGEFQYAVRLNNAPQSVQELNDLPVRVVNGATIYMRDVAHVRDGSAPQTNVVHVDGSRSVLMTVLKNGATSTLAIVEGIKQKVAEVQVTLPDAVKIVELADQSVFVRAAVEGVVLEGAIAAALTSAMILLFLGSWRSTVIIAVSIPLAILFAIIGLTMTGNTLNVMTLGGLALAVGILVDDATVTIENINWHLEQGKPVKDAILDGAQQIVAPAFVALLCICIVFVPMFLLPGVSGFLFVPMALAVVFAMVGSFVLSRTLVPTMAAYLLKPHDPAHHSAGHPGSSNPLVRFQRGFEARFERVRERYGAVLGNVLKRPRPFIIGFLGVVAATFLLVPFLGQNFFPSVDAGAIAIHVRGPTGSRVEETSAHLARIQREIRQVIPAAELVSVVDNIGLPPSSINVVYNNSGTVGPQDGDILIQLAEGHGPTADYVEQLRERLPRRFPGTGFAFLPADITSQILNFGAPAPIDVQVHSTDMATSHRVAQDILRRVARISGVADARIQQSMRYPQLNVNVDRTRIGQFGLTSRDVTTSVGASLAGTQQTAPVFFLNPQNGVSYPVVAQSPEYRVESVADLASVPVTAGGVPGRTTQVLGGLGSITRSNTAAVVSHYDLAPVVDIFATPSGRDLGAVSADILKVIETVQKSAPKGTTITLRGQYQTMRTAFTGLGFGLIGAILLIYLLIVVNFQSWLDPFVIITALPGALAGIVWMLFLTGTTLSVPALTGAIMCMGVATANSILVVSFARERLAIVGDAMQAAIEAGHTRFRPVLMTALAMIIGMLPMALGLGEGGEQNAPLGRAVIGGLIVATFATLMFVPVVFSLAHRRSAAAPASSGSSRLEELHV